MSDKILIQAADWQERSCSVLPMLNAQGGNRIPLHTSNTAKRLDSDIAQRCVETAFKK